MSTNQIEINHFITEIAKIIPRMQLITDELLRYAYATDASMYHMLPQLVLLVQNEQEVQQIIQLAKQFNIALTFRAAGTSLSGQAVTDQVLVVLSNNSWQGYSIDLDGKQITLEAGIIGARANQLLSNYHRQIGPDPSSISVAKIGGIIANNSSGICCGTAKNAYATITNIRAVFASGMILDTSDPKSISDFKQSNPDIIIQIARVREQIINDVDLSQFIRQKFSIKNTSGYNLIAFLDFIDPIQIIERLLVGSEGTLGFISQVTLHTVTAPIYKALNFIYADIESIIQLAVLAAKYEVSAIELLDFISLTSVSQIESLQPYLVPLDESVNAIMLELAADSENELQGKIAQLERLIANIAIIHHTGFITDKATAEILWKARKGVLPTVASNRPLGSTVVIEDVAVQIEQLPQLIRDLHSLFAKYNYTNAAIFGHVLAGNIHFILTPNFNFEAEVLNYDNFMHEFTSLVGQKFKGSLKAEHGSGRNISPFAVVEWGSKCLDIMWQIKKIFDPHGILNPDVKLTKDHTLHIKHIKQMPLVNEIVDKCMECGFCEPVCPSRKLSFTPRQRIAVSRKMATLDTITKAKWQSTYQYYAIDTCATTGMCQVECPVAINTGEYMRSLKKPESSYIGHSTGIFLAKLQVNLANVTANIIGRDNLHDLTTLLHSKFNKAIPVYLKTLPKASSVSFRNSQDNSQSKSITLFPGCPQRVFAETAVTTQYPSQLLLEKMGYQVKYPVNLKDLCCGQMYHSRGDIKQQDIMTKKLALVFNQQNIIVMDNSSCAAYAQIKHEKIWDINKFIAYNINVTQLRKRYAKLALHIDCSSSKHNFDAKYIEVLKCCADEIIIPDGIKCCGFAGDKGFKLPELNASSLSGLAKQVQVCEIGVTFNRNCQIGLTNYSGIIYQSFIELVLDCLV